MSNGVYVLPSAANGDVKPVVSSTPLVDFLMQLEDYTPTVGFLPHHLDSQRPLLVFALLLALVVYPSAHSNCELPIARPALLPSP